ncbi:squalene/phytoene synthase family protein [Streptomyces sp. FIT100]|uniref:squalene/phytoene synthase family protein n=1 Tax=Streptomyces sp. FIT100 TaxID=2837956 RepID=UPI0021C991E5|nr:squalene/phytoene synthase family protein [Streptomyces sp. FIT100]UUN29838.1 squalene/phytoene synthase family protein [Streptomyces sp. FIT100]
MSIGRDAERVLLETSRTFYIPVIALPGGLREPVMSFFLCLRAIDEIEDHPGIADDAKQHLLRQISHALRSGQCTAGTTGTTGSLPLLRSYSGQLPEISQRIGEWAALAPPTIACRTWETLSSIADRMAEWVGLQWTIDTQSDLDRYTFDVAGIVGLLLSDLWAWFDGTATDRSLAVGFGRGLQAINILQNREEDLTRNIDFFPTGWSTPQVRDYAVRNLNAGDLYVAHLPPGPVLDFCRVPLTLAWATLAALGQGRTKLTRHEVAHLLGTTMHRGRPTQAPRHDGD